MMKSTHLVVGDANTIYLVAFMKHYLLPPVLAIRPPPRIPIEHGEEASHYITTMDPTTTTATATTAATTSDQGNNNTNNKLLANK